LIIESRGFLLNTKIMRTEELKKDWERLVELFSERFGGGEEMDLDGILFLIGVQEVGQGYKKYKKHEKVDLIHVAICTLLQDYGYYEFSGYDDEGWPHFETTAKLPHLKAGEQSLLMKEAIVNYAKTMEWLD
jgi:hypothetical protein